MKSVSRVTGIALVGAVLSIPALASPLDVMQDVTLGGYTAHFTVTADPGVCDNCVVSIDPGKLGVIVTRPNSNSGALVDLTTMNDIAEATVEIKAYVTQAGSPVPIQGAFFNVTGTDNGIGLAGTTPFTPSGTGSVSLSPSGPASTTLTFTPPYTATLGMPYDNPLDLSAGIDGIDNGSLTSVTEDLIVATPEPASLAVMLAGLTGLLGSRRRRRIA